MDKFVKHTQIIGYFFDRTTYEFKLDFHASKELSLMWLLVRLPVGIVQAWSEVLMKVEMYALLNSGSKCTTCKSTSWWQAVQPEDEQKLENATESHDRKTINVDVPQDASSLNMSRISPTTLKIRAYYTNLAIKCSLPLFFMWIYVCTRPSFSDALCGSCAPGNWRTDNDERTWLPRYTYRRQVFPEQYRCEQTNR